VSIRQRSIAVVGGWHQAAVLGACFAEMGNAVTGIADGAAVESLSAGRALVHEPGLDALISQNLAVSRLRYTDSFADGLAGAEFVFVAIDTPMGPGDQPEVTPIREAVDAIARHASGSFLLCVTAQVPIGTCDELARAFASRPELSVPVAYVPEFLRLGTALETFWKADRFVIGAHRPEVAAEVAGLYEPLDRPLLLTDIRSAEMAKHACNAFLATSISFVNQVADLCEATGADVSEVVRVMRADRRIGKDAFLNAGLGYAGGTLGREVRALLDLGGRHGIPQELLAAVDLVNTGRVAGVVSRLKRVYAQLAGRRIGVLGLTYKSGTSTLRGSAALQLIGLLSAEGARTVAFDPLARTEELNDAPPFELAGEPRLAAQDADALVLVAPWPEIDRLDFRACAGVMKRPVLIDTGNHLAREAMQAAGFEYQGVGR
jgi:UDPglucose 6-dehydrogenase